MKIAQKPIKKLQDLLTYLLTNFWNFYRCNYMRNGLKNLNPKEFIKKNVVLC